MSEPISADRLNELLAKMYERRMIRVLFDDPTLPWLPESYWRERADAVLAAEGNTRDLLGLVDERRRRQALRRHEDEELMRNASVEDLLEEGIPTLQGPSEVLREAGWGRFSMKDRWVGSSKRPSIVQAPSFDFECVQCGRPITNERSLWTDHAGKSVCDLTFVDPVDVATGSYWTDHTPKPFHGEEEDEDDEE